MPENIIFTPGSGLGLLQGSFIGAKASHSTLGILEGLRFMCCFRFKLWLMTQHMGTHGKDIPLETRLPRVRSKDDTAEGNWDDVSTIYTVFLPLLEGLFCAVLQGNDMNDLEIYLESGK